MDPRINDKLGLHRGSMIKSSFKLQYLDRPNEIFVNTWWDHYIGLNMVFLQPMVHVGLIIPCSNIHSWHVYIWENVFWKCIAQNKWRYKGYKIREKIVILPAKCSLDINEKSVYIIPTTVKIIASANHTDWNVIDQIEYVIYVGY